MTIAATFNMLVSSLCAAALSVVVVGCDAAAPDDVSGGNAPAATAPPLANSERFQARAEPTGLPQQIDPEPAATDGAATIIAKEDITSGGGTACAFIIRYPGHVDQDVTWAKESCADIETRFLTGVEMKNLGLLDKLNSEARENVERLADGGVFYVESRFTASLFPLNVAGVAYEIPVRD
jgi:hypothetical protein